MSDLGNGSNVGGSPPRIPERLLAAVLRDPRVREDVLGDLHAAYQKYEQRSRVPGLRYWIAALDVGIRFLLPRRATASRPPTGDPSRGPGSMPGILLGDLRYAVRSLRKSPLFTAVVVLSLALGIGATSTIFSALNPILLRPSPFADPGRLVTIHESSTERPDARRIPFRVTLLEWMEHSSFLEQLEFVARQIETATYPSIGGAERYDALWVSPGLFGFLGVVPILGRNFVADDEDGEVIILSYGFWQRRFGGDLDLVGQTWGNQTVVGVMPPGFRIFSWYEADFWIGTGTWDAEEIRETGAWDSRWWEPIGRLKPGVSIEAAQTQLDAIARRLDGSGVSAESGWRVRVDPLHEFASQRFTGNLYLLMGAAVLLLLIACSNVASMLVGRATNRHREITTRAALGAGRLRLMRQFLTESVVLALFGGALGVLMAQVGTRLFVILAPTWYLPAEEIRVDGMVLGFTLGLSFLTAILFGMAPALRASNPDLARSLKQGGRGSPGGSRPLVQNLLVGSQIALTLVLLAGAALMVNSFVRLASVDRGFNPERLLTAQVGLDGERYVTSGNRDGNPTIVVSPEVDVFYREVLERLRALPGVEAAEIGTPFGFNTLERFTFLGRPALPPAEEPTARYEWATPGYFRAMGVPLLGGRLFTERDTEGSPWVAIINETMVRQYFPDEDPIGRSLLTNGLGHKPREIVGIVGDMRQRSLRRALEPTIYSPHAQHQTEYGWLRGIATRRQLVMRTTLEPMSLAADLRRIVAEVDPGEAVWNIGNMMEVLLDRWVAAERFWMRALGIFATLALVLAVVGIYGVVSYAVAQRTHEIGVRMALGAQRADVLGMVVRQGMVTTVGGVIVGVLGAVAATRLLSSQLYGVEATDPMTFATVSLVLVGIAVLASYIPARRAARVDPLIALRSE